jgi:hypothetical protein
MIATRIRATSSAPASAALAVVAQRRLRLLVPLGQRPAHPARARELAPGAAPGTKHELVRDAAEAVQALQALRHQVDLLITAYLADRHQLAATYDDSRQLGPSRRPGMSPAASLEAGLSRHVPSVAHDGGALLAPMRADHLRRLRRVEAAMRHRHPAERLTKHLRQLRGALRGHEHRARLAVGSDRHRADEVAPRPRALPRGTGALPRTAQPLPPRPGPGRGGGWHRDAGWCAGNDGGSPGSGVAGIAEPVVSNLRSDAVRMS